MPHVSIIIATYKREKVLCETLQSLLKQVYPNYEIIVVDQTSNHQQETENYLHKLNAEGLIRYYRLPSPSLPAARNFGVRHAKGEIVLFVDDDVRPDPQLIAAHAAEYVDPNIGGVAGRRTYPESAAILEEREPVGVITPKSDFVANFSASERHESVQWASGCNMSFRKNLIEQVGLFETKLIGSAVYEDADFSFRLRRAGYRIVFAPNAHLVHLKEMEGGCGNRLLNFRYYHGFVHNSLLFSYKNMSLCGLLMVIWDRLLMSLALVKQKRDLRFAILFISAFIRSVFSYATA